MLIVTTMMDIDEIERKKRFFPVQFVRDTRFGWAVTAAGKNKGAKVGLVSLWPLGLA
jgi:hypothetical protein